MFVVVMFETSALETLYSGQFILSTRFKKNIAMVVLLDSFVENNL